MALEHKSHTDHLISNQLGSIVADNWLMQNAPELFQLKQEELSAITHFLFLWSLYEAEILNCHSSAKAIEKATKQLAKEGLLTNDIFEPQINYFRNRYYVRGEFTCYFKDLNLRRNNSPELVKEVLRGVNSNLNDVVSALLIIVYRIRNNLFHGLKWSYNLSGQLENFYQSNATLMKAIDLHRMALKK